MEPIGFGIIAACLALSALFVVTSKNLVRGVLWLSVTLITTAALYILLGAEFVATIQVLLYTGGVITLMLFGVMLTRRVEGVTIENPQGRRGLALFISGGLFVLMARAILASDFETSEPQTKIDATVVGRSILSEHLLAFEVLSVLLLGAMIGAIVLARRRDPSDSATPQSLARHPEPRQRRA